MNKFYHTIKRKIHSLLFLLFDLSDTLASVLIEAKLIVQRIMAPEHRLQRRNTQRFRY